MLEGEGALLPPLGEEEEQPQSHSTGLSRRSPGDLELSTEKGKRRAQTSESWHRSSRDQGGSLSPFAAWLENATAALVLWQEQTPADGEVAQVHLGTPRLEFAVACPSGITKS